MENSLNTSAIASNIRKLRESRHWSQEELALASGVDVRPIQRAEAGRPLAVDTLKSVAAAFDTTIEGLQVSEEEIEAAVQDFRKKYKIVEMDVVNRSSDLGELVGSAEAIMMHRIGELSEIQLDQIAEFQDLLRDYLNIWRGLEMTSRREAEKMLYERVAALSSSGVSISFGMENMGLQMGDGKPLRMHVLYVAVSLGETPLRALVRERNMPISFDF